MPLTDYMCQSLALMRVSITSFVQLGWSTVYCGMYMLSSTFLWLFSNCANHQTKTTVLHLQWKRHAVQYVSQKLLWLLIYLNPLTLIKILDLSVLFISCYQMNSFARPDSKSQVIVSLQYRNDKSASNNQWERTRLINIFSWCEFMMEAHVPSQL